MYSGLSIKTKYVTIESPGPINALGGILGPIYTPCELDIKIVIKIVNSGKVVYEVNPKNTKEKVRLNISNVLKYNFKSTEEKIVKSNKTFIKETNVELDKVIPEPSTVQTTIVQESNNNNRRDDIGIDLFVSNKYS